MLWRSALRLLSELLDLYVIQLHRSIAVEYGNGELDLLPFGVKRLHGADEVFKRPAYHAHAFADGKIQLYRYSTPSLVTSSSLSGTGFDPGPTKPVTPLVLRTMYQVLSFIIIFIMT